MTNPTGKTYGDLNEAYDFFNKRLFDDTLPRCLITMQRRSKTYGYFAGGRFGTRDGNEITDEIALNPSHFQSRTTEQSLSTLVHEMVHLKQHHFGKPGRTAYHNKQWAQMMKDVGLYPSETGQEGGREVGQRVSHYILPGQPFDRACAELVQGGLSVTYVEVWGDEKSRTTKAASKTKYTCHECQTNAWAKPDTNLICGDCHQVMEVE
jgi:predicted SprT family Zn-dependent metalloprotease